MGKRPKILSQQVYRLGHVVVRTTDHRENGKTFALNPDVEGGEKKPLFTGHIEKGMGTQLRRLAHHFDDLEAGLIGDDQSPAGQ
ncbi:hypothetical protein [uncultured Ruegeria sp.]|uniref:hypothetical protein n=1 Tax=uncultured Ruegeria sp. TaxID=259304 RepID=UPI0026392547|nr:hypothetical protein [uncultured Ruegeria sp.]